LVEACGGPQLAACVCNIVLAICKECVFRGALPDVTPFDCSEEAGAALATARQGGLRAPLSRVAQAIATAVSESAGRSLDSILVGGNNTLAATGAGDADGNGSAPGAVAAGSPSGRNLIGGMVIGILGIFLLAFGFVYLTIIRPLRARHGDGFRVPPSEATLWEDSITSLSARPPRANGAGGAGGAAGAGAGTCPGETCDPEGDLEDPDVVVHALDSEEHALDAAADADADTAVGAVEGGPAAGQLAGAAAGTAAAAVSRGGDQTWQQGRARPRHAGGASAAGATAPLPVPAGLLLAFPDDAGPSAANLASPARGCEAENHPQAAAPGTPSAGNSPSARAIDSAAPGVRALRPPAALASPRALRRGVPSTAAPAAATHAQARASAQRQRMAVADGLPTTPTGSSAARARGAAAIGPQPSQASAVTGALSPARLQLVHPRSAAADRPGLAAGSDDVPSAPTSRCEGAGSDDERSRGRQSSGQSSDLSGTAATTLVAGSSSGVLGRERAGSQMEAVHANALCGPATAAAAGGEPGSAVCRTHDDPGTAVGAEQQNSGVEGTEGAAASVPPTAAAGSDSDDESPSPPMPYVQWTSGSLTAGRGHGAGGEQPSGLAI